MELLGPGDVLRPWDESADSELLQAVVRWSALAPTRLAILDDHLASRLAEYPEIHGALLERFAWRTRRLAVLQAISQMLGQLVGARRPSISTAVGTLTRSGEVVRGRDGTWLLTGAPVGAPDARASRFIAPRRAMFPPSADALGL